MSALLDVILPVFILIGFGYAAARSGLFQESAVDGLMRFAQSFAAPCLLFKSISALDLGAVYDLRLFLAFYIGAFTGFAAGFFGARLVFRRPMTDSIAIGFACFFSNSLLLGLPITERAYGTAALAGNFAILSIHAPMLYAFGITMMELARSHGTGLSAGRLGRQILRSIFSNPLVIGITAGFIVNLGGLPLPDVVSGAVDLMARAAIPTALFGLGGVLVRYRPEGDMRTIAMVCAVSLVLHPAVTWGLGRFVLHLDVAQLRSAVVTAAMAPGVNAFLFSGLYGVAMRVTASAVLLGTAASILTIWGWLHILP
jgi:malonate transporter